jgi:hypothetical protein
MDFKTLTRTVTGGVAALIAAGAIVTPAAAFADTNHATPDTTVETPVEALSEEGREWTDAAGEWHKVIYDRKVSGPGYKAAAAGTCPDGWYLHAATGTGGMDVGQGFRVNMTVEGRTRPSENAGDRTYATLADGRKAVRGSLLNLYNYAFDNRVHVEMVCTKDTNKAWVP